MQAKIASFLFLSASALAGCGASSNSAPIVYGTQPASGRVYNSPADVYMAPQARAPQTETYARAPAPQTPVRAAYSTQSALPSSVPSYGRPAPLTPITAATYQEDVPLAPVYVAETQPVSPPAPRWDDAAPKLITVRPGDTVYAISRRTGISPNAIIAENRLAPPYAISVGETLRIPSARDKVANTIAQPARPLPVAQTGIVHVVKPGDTLYSISRQSGVSVAMLAQANALRPPYTLSVGDQLQMPVGAAAASAPYATQQQPSSLSQTVSYNQPASKPKDALFEWPVKGAIIGKYGSGEIGRRNDGVNIAAPVGTPVRASADGEVVYRGSELDGYGNLLLVKHDDGFVTAYAHNDVMLVRKGQKVRQGQIIAKVGQTGSAPEPQLHFEIRQNLKSVDPLAFLQQ